jgi:hypothetical protein
MRVKPAALLKGLLIISGDLDFAGERHGDGYRRTVILPE